MQKRKLREPVHSFLAGISADPLGIFLLGREEIVLVFIGAAILFLPLFVFLEVIRPEGGEECISILRVPAQNDPTRDESERGCHHLRVREERAGKKVLWTVFAAMAWLVLARCTLYDPHTTILQESVPLPAPQRSGVWRWVNQPRPGQVQRPTRGQHRLWINGG